MSEMRRERQSSDPFTFISSQLRILSDWKTTDRVSGILMSGWCQYFPSIPQKEAYGADPAVIRNSAAGVAIPDPKSPLLSLTDWIISPNPANQDTGIQSVRAESARVRTCFQSLSDVAECVQSARKADGLKVEQSVPSEDMARKQRFWPRATSFQPVFGSAPEEDDGQSMQMFTLCFILTIPSSFMENCNWDGIYVGTLVHFCGPQGTPCQAHGAALKGEWPSNGRSAHISTVLHL